MNDRDGDHQQELRRFRPRDEAIDEPRLQAVAEREEHRGDRHQHDQRIEAESREQGDGDVHGDRHHLAMGEIDDAHDAEDDGQAERHQPVDQAGQDAADGNVKIDFERHPAPPKHRSGRRGGRSRFACRRS